jgi:hypothetical protein
MALTALTHPVGLDRERVIAQAGLTVNSVSPNNPPLPQPPSFCLLPPSLYSLTRPSIPLPSRTLVYATLLRPAAPTVTVPLGLYIPLALGSIMASFASPPDSLRPIRPQGELDSHLSAEELSALDEVVMYFSDRGSSSSEDEGETDEGLTEGDRFWLVSSSDHAWVL